MLVFPTGRYTDEMSSRADFIPVPAFAMATYVPSDLLSSFPGLGVLPRVKENPPKKFHRTIVDVNDVVMVLLFQLLQRGATPSTLKETS